MEFLSSELVKPTAKKVPKNLTKDAPLYIIISAKGWGGSTTRRKVYHTKPKGHHTTAPPMLLYLIYWNHGTSNNTTASFDFKAFRRHLRKRWAVSWVHPLQYVSGETRARTCKGSRFTLENVRRAFLRGCNGTPQRKRCKNRTRKRRNCTCYHSQWTGGTTAQKLRSTGKKSKKLRGWNSEAWHLLRFSLQPFGFLYLTTCKNDKSRKKRNFKRPKPLISKRMRWRRI